MAGLDRFALGKRIGLSVDRKTIAETMRKTVDGMDAARLTQQTEVHGSLQEAVKWALLDNKMPAYYNLASLQTSESTSISATFIGLARANGRFPLIVTRKPNVDVSGHLEPHEAERLTGLNRIWNLQLQAFDITLVVPANLHVDWKDKCNQFVQLPREMNQDERRDHMTRWVANYLRMRAIETDSPVEEDEDALRVNPLKDSLAKLLVGNEFMDLHRDWAGPNPPVPTFLLPRKG